MNADSRPKVTSFLIKIASRCNLACDYCYIYEHADQTWRQQPTVMSEAVRRTLASRIAEYAGEEHLQQILVAFHGGEPLLAGAGTIIETARWIRAAVPAFTRVDCSLQTNGLLLDGATLDRFQDDDIGVSLSIDGPAAAHDLHRLDHSGKSCYEKTAHALSLLEAHPAIYDGLISVIDPRICPDQLLSFFASRCPPRVDFLLPDATHERLPPLRVCDAGAYERWLLRAFDIWFDHYPDLQVRTFDAILSGIAGLPSNTDALGFGDVSLLTIETDGTYHDLDVLKITRHGATALDLDIGSHSIADATRSPKIAAHRQLLTREGLAEGCQNCAVVHVCGGGAVPHRFSRQGFRNPSVYCRELLSLITHAQMRMSETLHIQRERRTSSPEACLIVDLAAWERAETAGQLNQELVARWSTEAVAKLIDVLWHVETQYPHFALTVNQLRNADSVLLGQLATLPAATLWTHVMTEHFCGRTVLSIEGDPIRPDPGYVSHLHSRLHEGSWLSLQIHKEDRWLRLPFGSRIVFETDSTIVDEGLNRVNRAFEIIRNWCPALLEEIRTLNRDVQFIRDASASPEKAVSFSDNSVPGVLYIGIRTSAGLIDAHLLADSIIHEHRHQKLYLLQRALPLVAEDSPLVRSPWREDLRPPSGLLHAVFVFVQLYAYWVALALNGSDRTVENRAHAEARSIRERLTEAFTTLRTTRLTQTGNELVEVLRSRLFNAGP